jgi:apolipoprotein N-acyltransferase
LHLQLLQKQWSRYAACVVSGLFLFLCFPLPNWNLLVWIASAPLLAALVRERRPWHAFFQGYLTGAIFFTGSCYWFVYVMERHGGLGAVLAVGVLLLFVLVFSLYFGAFGLVIAWAAKYSQMRALALSPFLWVSMEIARTYILTGFPWNLLGYAVQSPGLQRLACFTAVYGLSFMAVATSALIVAIFTGSQQIRARVALAIWMVILVCVNWMAGPPVLPPGQDAAILIQPDVPLDVNILEHWAPWKEPGQLQHLVDLSLEAREKVSPPSQDPPLIIWSENPAPFYFDRDQVFRQAMEKMARDAKSDVVVGTMTTNQGDGGRPRNSAIVLDPQGHELLQYDKIHLVPFGEYVPEWAFPGKIGKITLEVGDFVAGTNYQVARIPQGGIGIFICYEAIFPQLVRKLTAQGASVLVTISDDTWFGNSSAAFQHLEMARFRAIENGRYLLRSTNDGITALIDPYGRVVETAPRHGQRVLSGRFSYLEGQTFYTLHGDVFAWGCVVATLAALAAWALKDGRAKG